VLADDRPGDANQALAVAEALAWPFTIKPIRYGPLARLPNTLLGASLHHLTGAPRAALVPPWPDVVIAAGRRTAPVARWLKRRQPRLFHVQLMWPGSARGIDLIAAPAHDGRAGRGPVLLTAGPPHRITPTRLATAAEALAPRLAGLPRPYVACLVGGSNRRTPFTPADAQALAHAASRLAQARGGSLLVTTSRRTGAACTAALSGALAGPHFLHPFTSAGDNPYLGLLGAADGLIVTADSAAMCVEACATGKPVFLFHPAAGSAAKLARLHRSLEEQGHLHPLGAAWPAARPPPANPAASIAAAIRARLSGGEAGPAVVSRSPTA
jgi:mitochondrial fission protein ELM1